MSIIELTAAIVSLSVAFAILYEGIRAALDHFRGKKNFWCSLQWWFFPSSGCLFAVMALLSYFDGGGSSTLQLAMWAILQFSSILIHKAYKDTYAKNEKPLSDGKS